MNADELIKKKKINVKFYLECVQKYDKDGYITYNAFQHKDKRKLTKEEFIFLMRYIR